MMLVQHTINVGAVLQLHGQFSKLRANVYYEVNFNLY